MPKKRDKVKFILEEKEFITLVLSSAFEKTRQFSLNQLRVIFYCFVALGATARLSSLTSTIWVNDVAIRSPCYLGDLLHLFLLLFVVVVVLRCYCLTIAKASCFSLLQNALCMNHGVWCLILRERKPRTLLIILGSLTMNGSSMGKSRHTTTSVRVRNPNHDGKPGHDATPPDWTALMVGRDCQEWEQAGGGRCNGERRSALLNPLGSQKEFL